ncbi:MAG: peptide-methionine (R)-S-oxide reductase MsrB [Candidatus Kapaibacterium sp.]
MLITAVLFAAAMVWLSLSAVACSSQSKQDMSSSRDSSKDGVPSVYTAHLSDAEFDVIVNKGTDRPGDGGYTNVFDEGVYHCRACGTALYESMTKFHSGCGWPSFETEIPGTVKRNVDRAYGMIRTEIVCATCGGHLGHEFQGERITPANNRHCVNTSSITFHPKDTRTYYVGYADGTATSDLQYRVFRLPGVLSTNVGVVATATGRSVEVVRILVDPSRTSLSGVLAALRQDGHRSTEKEENVHDASVDLVIACDRTSSAKDREAVDRAARESGSAVTVMESTSFTPAPAERQHERLRASQRNPGR